MKSGARLSLVALGLAATHLLLGAVVAPWALRRQLPALAASNLHRQASVERVRVNPYTLRTTLVGLALRDRDGSPLFGADTIVVNLSARSLLKRAVILDELRIHRPSVVFRLGPDGRPTIADLLEDTTAATDSTATAEGSTPFAMDDASLVNGSIDFIDESRSPVYRESFRDLTLALDHISTLPDERGSHELAATFATGATIKWRGQARWEPLLLEGRLELARLRLTRISQAFLARLPLEITNGELDASASYRAERGEDGVVGVHLPDLAAAVREVVVRPDGGTEDWLRMDGAALERVQVRWPERTVQVSTLRLTKPWVLARRDADSTLNWASLEFPAAEDSAAADSLPWSTRVDSIVVAEGTLRVEDRSALPALALDVTPVAIRLTDFTSDSTRPFGVHFTAAAEGGTTLSASGTVTRGPLAAELELAARDVDLTHAQRYLGAAPPITIADGRATVQGKARVSEGGEQVVFEGTSSVDRVFVRDAGGDSLLAWRAMNVAGLQYRSEPALLRIRSIRVDRPFARVAISKTQELNLAIIAAQLAGDTIATTDTAAAPPALPYEIGEVTIANGRVDFSDASLILPFRTIVDSTQGTFEDIASFGTTPGAMRLEGLVDRDGIARATGTLQLADPYAATDVRVEFRNIDFTRLTPYSAQFAGYAIRTGRLDVDLRYRVRERQLDADHHVVAKNLELGDKVEGGESPGFLVKLAVSLLKDRDGRITLDVPVTGSVDDPQFSYRAVAWQAVKTMLGNAAKAPFRFLGGLLGVGGDAPELVEFDPGSSVVIPPERVKLDSLAAELGRKAELLLSVAGRYDSVSDAAALREAKLVARTSQRRDSLFKGKQGTDTTSTALGRALESLYAETFGAATLDSVRDSVRVAASGPAARDPKRAAKARGGYESPTYFALLRERLIARMPVTAEELTRLGQERGESIRAVLVAAGVSDSSRVRVEAPSPVTRKKEGSPRVSSELAIDAR